MTNARREAADAVVESVHPLARGQIQGGGSGDRRSASRRPCETRTSAEHAWLLFASSVLAIERKEYARALQERPVGRAPVRGSARGVETRAHLRLAELLSGVAQIGAGRLDVARAHLDAQSAAGRTRRRSREVVEQGARGRDRAGRRRLPEGRGRFFGRRTVATVVVRLSATHRVAAGEQPDVARWACTRRASARRSCRTRFRSIAAC